MNDFHVVPRDDLIEHDTDARNSARNRSTSSAADPPTFTAGGVLTR